MISFQKYMDSVCINKSEICGTIEIPPSKSVSHRALICAALSPVKSTLDNLIFSKDMDATISCLENLGAVFKRDKKSVEIQGVQSIKVNCNKFQCNESGSTIRFMIPIALLDEDNHSVIFDGKGKLVTRPLKPYTDLFLEKEIEYKYNNQLPLEIMGNLKSGTYKLPGDISSQFVTGLMFALSKLYEDSTIEITSNLESKSYVDITIDVLSKYGVNIENEDYRKFYIKGNQTYKAFYNKIEGDFSQAAFFIVAGTINESISITGLNKNSFQGDREIINIVNRMGGNVYFDSNELIVKKSDTIGADIDVSDIPDLVPILAVLAVFSRGTTRIYNGMRVRLKESDRIKAMYTELKKLGADIVETEDGLIINGTGSLKSGKINSWNDHRIAMAMAIAAINSDDQIEIEDHMAINKSYPNFYVDLKSLGVSINE